MFVSLTSVLIFGSILLAILGVVGVVYAFRTKRRLEMTSLIAETIPQLVYVGDSTGRGLYLNKHWSDFTGLTREELQGYKWCELIHPDDIEGMLEARDHTRKLELPFEYPARLRRHDGEYRWFVVKSYPHRDRRTGKITRWYGTYTDIHDQVLVQKDLELVNERLEQVLESAEIGIWEVDLSTGLVTRNPGHDRIYGYGENLPVWTYQDFMNAIHDGDRAGVREHIDRVARSDENDYSAEFRLVWPNGEVHWVSSRAKFLRDASGKTTHVRGIIWDVTALKLAQETAEGAARAKSQFLANVSHELRTPLGAILGFQRMLRDIDLTAEERSSYHDIVDRNGNALLRLIDDVLDLSRVEAGALGIEVGSIPLATSVTDIVHAFGPQLEATGNSLDVQFVGPTPSTFVSDPHRFRQIITNLVSNAVKFTKGGEIHLIVEARGEWLTFDVVDEGAGIDKSVQDSLFKPFRQGDETITRKYGGTGLGLALSRELARALGGDLKLVESSPTRGSRFRLQLPLVEGITVAPAEATLPKRPVSRSAALAGYRILVVEDSPDNQLLVRRALQRVGAEVEIANNGLEGLDRALAEDFDLVLMDMQMPVMDGETATRKLRAAGYEKPIFALTAHAMREQRDTCLRVGCTEHVAKPVDFVALTDLILTRVQKADRIRTDASSSAETSRTSRTTHIDSTPSL